MTSALSGISSDRQWEVLGLLRGAPSLTRAAIGARTGLGPSQVSRITAELIGAGLVETVAAPSGRAGRPPEALRLSGGRPWAVGLEVGGGRQRSVLVNLRGEPVLRADAPLAAATGDEAVGGFVGQVRALAKAAGVPAGEVAAVGLALYAAVDPVAGRVVEWSEEPGWLTLWHDVDLRAELGARLGAEAVAIDDAVRMRAVAEVRDDGAARQADALYVLADTGIGATLLRQGRPDLGGNGLAGDIGHVAVDADGAWCACGRRGCLEAVASARAVEQAAARAGRPAPIEALVAAAAEGDALPARLLAEAGERLADVLAPIVGMLAPGRLMVSGRLAESDAYLGAMTARLFARLPPRLEACVAVSRARLGEDGGRLGAALAALDALFEGRSRPGRGGETASSAVGRAGVGGRTG